MDRFGDDKPGILFGYGKALLEQGKSLDAAKIFNRASQVIQNSGSKDLEVLVQEYLQKSLSLNDPIGESSQTSIIAASDRLANLNNISQVHEDVHVTISHFRQFIASFCKYIKSQERMSFWTRDKSNKKYAWVSSPENFAKTLFRTAINMHYREALETIDEVAAGAGRIDLYLIFRSGIRAVVELKMCGQSYSQNYAMEGHEQITHYMEHRKTHIGFLIVFDGRLRDCGKNIPKITVLGNQTIYNYCVDVRHTYKNDKI